MMVTPLTRPIQRRVGRLVFTITEAGIEMRGYRCRVKRKLVTWDQIASLASVGELLAAAEQTSGHEQLVRMKADPNVGAKPS